MSDATENVAIRFTPLSGGHSLAPPCYLLEIGGIKLLLDCGWCDPFDVEMLKPLLRVVQDVDAVLLSHGNVEHLGALPYAFEKGLSCPVYCTGPVKTLGHLAMYDAYLSKHYNAPFSVFTPDSIDYAWERLVPLKFSQHLMLEGPGRSGAVVVGGIEITPYAAGHTLGGAVWRIKIGMDEIVYCSHYNHMNERHLDKTILQTLQRPMLLICGSSNALTVHNDKRSDRDKLLFETVATTLRAGGNVLIPMDAVGRVMEVAVLLDTMWQQTRPQGSLVMLSSQAYNVTVATSSLLEWMSKHISKSFQSTADFSLLPSVHRCHSTEDLLRVPQPVVVMASTADLESGFARELFAHWAGNSKNAVVLVDRSLPGTLANSLATSCVQGAALPKTLAVKVSKRVVLAGQELDAYRRTKEIERLQLLERQRLENAKKELSEAQDYDDAREETLDTLTQFVPDNPYFKDATQFDVIPGDLPPGSASPMFPLSRLVAPDVPRADNVGDWSAYGTVFDVSMFDPESKKKAAAAAAASSRPEKEAAVAEEAPSKIESMDLLLSLNASVRFIDLEGKSDGKSLRTVIHSMLPRSAIFVRGEKGHLEVMKQFALTELLLTKVHAPDVGQTVDASSDAQMYSAWLQDLLRASLRWQVLDDYEIAYVSSRVEAVEMQDKQERRVLTVAANDVEEESTHRSIFIGQPALKDVKTALDKMGFSCEFQQGTLVVNDCVSVRKEVVNGSTVMRVEGAYCSDLFEVRSILYGQLKML